MIPIAIIAVIALAFGGYKLLADDESEDTVASGHSKTKGSKDSSRKGSSSADGEVEIEGSWSGGEATVFYNEGYEVKSEKLTSGSFKKKYEASSTGAYSISVSPSVGNSNAKTKCEIRFKGKTVKKDESNTKYGSCMVTIMGNELK